MRRVTVFIVVILFLVMNQNFIDSTYEIKRSPRIKTSFILKRNLLLYVINKNTYRKSTKISESKENFFQEMYRYFKTLLESQKKIELKTTRKDKQRWDIKFGK